MPTETQLLPAQNILFARCYGLVSEEDIIGWNVDNRILPNANQRLQVVVDLSDVTETEMSFNDINATHAQLTRHYGARRESLHLLLYAPNDVAYGMARIMQSLSLMSETLIVDLFQNEKDLGRLLPKLKETFADLRRLSQTLPAQHLT